MNKRQFFTKTLLASLPVAADMLHAAPDEAAAENVQERIASFAGKIAEEPTVVFETQMVIWDEMDAEPGQSERPRLRRPVDATWSTGLNRASRIKAL